MSTDDQDQRKRRKGRARRIARAMARPRMYLLLLAPALATALVVTLLPKSVSLADTTPSDDGVSWLTGQVDQENDGGTCVTIYSGGIATPDISNVVNALDDVPAQDVNEDSTKDYYIANIGEQDTADTGVTGEADVDCSLVQTAFLTGPGSRSGVITAQLTTLTRPDGIPYASDQGARAGILTPASDPDIYLTGWFSGAIADLAATAAYIAISAVTIGTMIALGATLGPGGELASAALGALAGCIGGAVSTAILLAIGGGSTTALGTVTNAAAGCVTGAALSQIPVHSAGQWLGNQFNALIGNTGAIAGSALESAASSAGVSLSPMAQAMSDAIAGLGGV